MQVMNSLRIALVQTDLQWHKPAANLDHLSVTLAPLAGSTDVVVLPEMFTSGFTHIPEPLYGDQHTTAWLLQQAALLHAVVIGSVAYEVPAATADDNGEQPKYVNRLLFATPEGQLHHYDKCHLFQMGDEHLRYQAGRQRCVVHYRDWRFLLTTCYDIRFPVFCRNVNDYDILVCVANWPQSRRHAWRTLLQARAIENQAYVLGVNRVGTDGNGLVYSGDSMVVDHLGAIVAGQQDESAVVEASVLTATISKDNLLRARKSFPVASDADAFTLPAIQHHYLQ